MSVEIAEPTISNFDELIQYLNSESERGCSEHAGLIDFNEPKILDDFTYKQLQFKKYGYAVKRSKQELL